MTPPGLLLDTTFLIDLERELKRGVRGVMQDFLLQRIKTRTAAIAFVTVGELATGFAPAGKVRFDELVRPYHVIAYTPEVAWQYGLIDRYLRDERRSIGANDTWIAACARAHGLGVVTRNEAHFRRVPHLEVLSY